MSNSDSNLEIHWLIKMAQDIREGRTSSLDTNKPSVDPDLAHPALSILGELTDRCGYDIKPDFLQGYAYGLNQAGLIDDAVLRTIETHVGNAEDNDLTQRTHEH
jgi:hypothetical protein